MSLRLVPVFALACALGTAAASAQTPAVPVFDISVRVHPDDPGLEIEGQVVVPARSSPVASVELQLDRRIVDLEVSIGSPPDLPVPPHCRRPATPQSSHGPPPRPRDPRSLSRFDTASARTRQEASTLPATVSCSAENRSAGILCLQLTGARRGVCASSRPTVSQLRQRAVGSLRATRMDGLASR